MKRLYKHQHFILYILNRGYLLLIFLIISNFSMSQFDKDIIVGAERLNIYLEDLKNKKIGLVANQTSMIKNEHLLDVLLIQLV